VELKFGRLLVSIRWTKRRDEDYYIIPVRMYQVPSELRGIKNLDMHLRGRIGGNLFLYLPYF